MSIPLTPLETKIRENIAYLESKLNQSVPAQDVSFITILATVAALASVGAEKRVAYESLDNLIGTASLEKLKEMGRSNGAIFREAVSAQVFVTLPVTAGSGEIVYQGDLFLSELGLIYRVASSIQEVAGLITFEVIADEPGARFNLISTNKLYPRRVYPSATASFATVANPALKVVGTDDEDTEVYRERVQSRERLLTGGGNFADYKLWAEEVPGVKEVYPFSGKPYLDYGTPDFIVVGGNLYFVDTLNHVIKKVVLSTGVVSIFAGYSGLSGSANGVGATARFNGPFGIGTDGTNLYVADTGSHTIRKIVIATIEVTTIAGTAGIVGTANGTGAAARFNGPHDVTSDGTNLYVVDTGNHTIRKIVIATGVVTTLAGTAGLSGSADGTGAAARFNGPHDVATDGTNLYVADTGNHTIRKIVISTGVVTTLAGAAGVSGFTDATGAAARFNGPHGIIQDGTNVYVSDTGNHTIRQIVIATAVVTTLAGLAGVPDYIDATGVNARFNTPHGIYVSGTDLYVADILNQVIRKVVISSGVVTTLPGYTGQSYPGDRTIFVECTDDINVDNIPPVSLLTQVTQSICFDAEGLARPPLGLTPATLYVRPITRGTYNVIIYDAILTLDSRVDAEIQVEAALEIFFRGLNPFVEGAMVHTEKNDIITPAAAGVEIQKIFKAYGGAVGAVAIFGESGDSVAGYVLQGGEHAKLGTVTFNYQL